jgi:hypothetical protein
MQIFRQELSVIHKLTRDLQGGFDETANRGGWIRERTPSPDCVFRMWRNGNAPEAQKQWAEPEWDNQGSSNQQYGNTMPAGSVNNGNWESNAANGWTTILQRQQQQQQRGAVAQPVPAGNSSSQQPANPNQVSLSDIVPPPPQPSQQLLIAPLVEKERQKEKREPARFISLFDCCSQDKDELPKSQSKAPPGAIVSRGSVGHPRTCAEACKYAHKPRGCKDGSACDRCHLCQWRRYGR